MIMVSRVLRLVRAHFEVLLVVLEEAGLRLLEIGLFWIELGRVVHTSAERDEGVEV